MKMKSVNITHVRDNTLTKSEDHVLRPIRGPVLSLKAQFMSSLLHGAVILFKETLE